MVFLLSRIAAIVGGGGPRSVSTRYGPHEMLEFRILGPLEVVGECGAVELGGPKQRATLGILLLSANRVVPIDRLADELYAGAAPATALKQVQRQIMDLRRTTGEPAAIETRSPGYVLRIGPDQLDLAVFERLTREAADALGVGDAGLAEELLRRALGLWRGPALADLTYEPFARAAIERLEEIRVAAVQRRIEAALALGRHGDLVGELEQLVAEHPLREPFRAQLMLALYRSGRQAEALEAYRRARAALVDGLGIEPGSALRELERLILAQDPSLNLRRTAHAPLPDGIVLAVAATEDAVDPMLSLGRPLAKRPGKELIVARLVATGAELADAAASVNARRKALDVPARAAAFTSVEPAADVVRLAAAYDVELVLLQPVADVGATHLPDDLAAILEGSPADVAMLTGGTVDWAAGAGVFVPFGGARHDWAALELAAWAAAAAEIPLSLVGARGDATHGRRDASRLLAHASLAVQRLAGVVTAPTLADPTEDALLAALEGATLVVAGISERWRPEGIGAVRRALVRRARVPVVLVHAGHRPGGLAPRDSRTRFTWSIER
jgi:DNA-binding SARP family transcriptional activator